MSDDLFVVLEAGVKQLQSLCSLNQEDYCPVFILGTTGAGKSTLAKILEGNLSCLKAVDDIILDDTNLIGTGSESKTFLPNRTVSKDGKTVFWDLPGFEENRGADQDIACMYFLHYLFTVTKTAKVLFTLEYSSITAGNRTGFEPLLGHVTKIFPKPSHWKDCYGLVVTKVPHVTPKGKMLTDKQILNQITDFLSNYLEQKKVRLRMQDNNDKKLVESLERKISVVEYLVTSQNISFVRFPSVDEGILEADETIIQAGKDIQKLFSEKLAPKPIHNHDIQISLKDSTRNSIREIFLPKLDELAVKHFERFAQQIDTELQKREVLKPHVGKDNFGRVDIIARSVEICLEKMLTPESSLDQTCTIKSKLGLILLYYGMGESFGEFLEPFDEIERQLNFFESVMTCGQLRGRPDKSWLKPLQDNLERVKQTARYFQFCNHVEQRIVDLYFPTLCKLIIPVYRISQEQALKFIEEYKIASLSNDIIRVCNAVEFQHYLHYILKSKIKLQLLTKSAVYAGGIFLSKANAVIQALEVEGGLLVASEYLAGLKLA